MFNSNKRNHILYLAQYKQTKTIEENQIYRTNRIILKSFCDFLKLNILTITTKQYTQIENLKQY